MDRGALAGFLRRRRETLQPGDVGLPDGVRRRAPGLRREEVASLAAMSTDYYTRIEQGRLSDGQRLPPQFGLAEISVTPSVLRHAEEGLAERGWKIASIPS